MNYKLIGKIISFILLIETGLLLPSVGIAIFEKNTLVIQSLLYTIGILLIVAAILYVICRNASKKFYAKEGLIATGLSWIVLSIFGALPFVFSGAIPNYFDALFEMASGFTTTGASVVSNIEGFPKALVFWHSFSHWLGGMGVLVFLMAIIPLSGNAGFSLHLLKAESPGPSVGKLTPKIRKTAFILYELYLILTVLNVIFLMLGKLPLFDALCIGFGTAATGGFGLLNDSFVSYSPYIQNVTTVFMYLFAINFSLYYLLLLKQVKSFFKDQELRMFVGVVVVSIIIIVINLRGYYPTLGETIRHAAFQVATTTSTTGFATTDFNQWPALSKSILLCLMCMGACAGSTGGGFKVSRILLLIKAMKRNIIQYQHPQSVQIVRLNGQKVDEQVITNTTIYLAIYVLVALLSFIIISIDGFSIETNISAVIACLNNIGPGFDAVGPAANYAAYSSLSKVVLLVDMLIGRLEILPIVVLFLPSTWKKM